MANSKRSGGKKCVRKSIKSSAAYVARTQPQREAPPPIYPPIRPWPSAELRARALKMVAEAWRYSTRDVDTDWVRNLVEVVVRDGPAIVCTAEELDAATEEVGERPDGDPDTVSDGELEALLRDSVDATWEACVLADELGMTLVGGGFRGAGTLAARSSPWVVRTEYGSILSITNADDGSVRVRVVGRQLGAKRYPNMTTGMDGGPRDGSIVPAYDDV